MTSEYTPEQIEKIKSCEAHGWRYRNPGTEQPAPLGRSWNPRYGGLAANFCCNDCAVGKENDTAADKAATALKQAIQEMVETPTPSAKTRLNDAMESYYMWWFNSDELYMRACELLK